MTLKTKSTNVLLHALIRTLRKVARENNAKIWRAVADILERPRRKRVIVNLSKINRLTKSGEVIIVPGKVLGGGELDHPLKVAALGFSESARKKIINAGGQTLTIEDLIKENPKGSNVRIII
ncbi:MAG: 50S ribosomal protein L18e [Candidatus Njordarchaeales archaeon]